MPELKIIACFGIENLEQWQNDDFLPIHIKETGFKKNLNCAIKHKDDYTIKPDGIIVWDTGAFNYMWGHSLSEPSPSSSSSSVSSALL